MSLTEVALGFVIVIGLVGILVPVLPGSVLVLAAIVAWALEVRQTEGWVVVAVAAGVLLAGTVAKYAVPGRRLKEAGVPARTQWIGAGVALVGFFVVPVVGIFLGFVGGVYLAERVRVGGAEAWPSTVRALRAVGLSILIELVAGLLAAGTWVVGLAVT